MKSLAHPDWPYSGTPWEWRGFAEKAKQDEAQPLFELLWAAVYQKQNFGPELK
jgi:hypothetical protein